MPFNSCKSFDVANFVEHASERSEMSFRSDCSKFVKFSAWAESSLRRSSSSLAKASCVAEVVLETSRTVRPNSPKLPAMSTWWRLCSGSSFRRVWTSDRRASTSRRSASWLAEATSELLVRALYFSHSSKNPASSSACFCRPLCCSSKASWRWAVNLLRSSLLACSFSWCMHCCFSSIVSARPTTASMSASLCCWFETGAKAS
mmetsp:Transcript_17704/g.37910  ORF Transcript_17704/g.37910 Transcript_17704/m.37910 type:complete len:203 (+) Transcript_17704:802-1410(+)